MYLFTVVVEYADRCDLLRVPPAGYAAVAFGLNTLPCRYWVHTRQLPLGIELKGLPKGYSR